MPVVDLFHRRKLEAARDPAAEVYQYDVLPQTLRTQLRQIIAAAIGDYFISSGYGHAPPHNNDAWDALVGLLRKEFGVDHLVQIGRENAKKEVLQFLDVAPTDHALSAVEACCRLITRFMGKKSQHGREQVGATQRADDAVAEINARFRQAGLGYEFIGDEIVRVDSRLLHAETVKPALSLLADNRFAGAEQEFREAHRKHRSGDNKGAVTDANCAFESTMKAICDIHGWPYDKRARASDLLKVLRANGLFPDYLEKSFDQLQAVLASGLPEVRNNAGSHGQGAAPKETPDYVGAFAIHLAAAKIVYLCEASKALELTNQSLGGTTT